MINKHEWMKKRKKHTQKVEHHVSQFQVTSLILSPIHIQKETYISKLQLNTFFFFLSLFFFLLFFLLFFIFFPFLSFSFFILLIKCRSWQRLNIFRQVKKLLKETNILLKRGHCSTKELPEKFTQKNIVFLESPDNFCVVKWNPRV